MERIYSVQSYLVKFDMGNPVEVSVSVYHENQTELTKDEILEEAMSYIKEVNIDLTEKDVYEIVTLEKE